MIDGKNFFDQPVKNDMRTYDNIRKFRTGQGNDYTSSYLLGYSYFKEYYKMIVLDLSKQQALDAHPKEMYIHYRRSKKYHFRFFARNHESIVVLFCFDTMLK